MLSWNEYIEELLSTPTVLDNMSLRNNGNAIAVSPIVKASIQMLESMIETEGRHNVFVFPEIKELLYEFVISKTVFNVAAGKINIAYDLCTFKPGQKLKYKNCIVEFDKYVEKDYDGAERVYIRFSDGDKYGVPAKIAPIFQLADEEAKRFSNQKTFLKTYSAKKAIEELALSPDRRDIIDALADYKTHLDASIFLVTNVSAAKEYFDKTYINGTPLKDVLLIGKIQTDGSVDSCYPGQLSGNPAIVLASDLYSVFRAIDQGAKAQSIIINTSQGNIVENQLDTLDDLAREDFPILCLTDTSNSFDVDVLLDRNYNVWRWDANSLVESILSSSLRTAGCRIHNCAAQNIIYERVDNIEIDAALQLLYSHKSEIEEQGANVIAVYNKLFSLLFTSLRIAVPFERKEIVRTQKTLEESKGALELEQRFMSQDLYNDLMGAVSNFEKVFTMTFQNPKVSRIAEIISSKKYSSICIVIADKLDKMRCEAYWRNYGVRKHSPTVVRVLYPQEYANSDTVRCDATIVVRKLFKSVSLVKKLRETRAFVGFSRLQPNTSATIKDKKAMLRLGNANWLPAIEVYGEGIFFEFSSDELKSWAEKDEVKKRMAPLNTAYQQSFFGKATPGNLRAEYVLLHTFAHLIINQLIERQVYIIKAEVIISAPKTKASIRTVILPPSLLKILAAYKETVDSEWMFPSPTDNGRPRNPSSVRKRLQLILERAGCKKVRFHDLRHTFATMALEHGMDVKTLSATIGHVSSATTLDIYSHITDTMQRQAAVHIDRKIGGTDAQMPTAEPSARKDTVPIEFTPYKPKIRKPGTGCVTMINDHLYEGRYTPTNAYGKRESHNIYAKTREECEEKLAEMIADIKAQIKAEKEKMTG